MFIQEENGKEVKDVEDAPKELELTILLELPVWVSGHSAAPPSQPTVVLVQISATKIYVL